jgi:AraC-like DNA-binding protein
MDPHISHASTEVYNFRGQIEMSISGPGQDPGCRVDCTPEEPIVIVSLILEPDRLVPLVRSDDLTAGTSWRNKESFGSYCYCENRLCPSVKQAARQLLNFNATASAQRLYGLAKALELLALTIGPSCPKEGPVKENRDHRITASEKQQLYKAKEILDENYTNPPMLPELARLIGTNQTKLKRSFKRLFGVCISGYLLKRRMEKGYQLLQTGEMNVSEVAHHLGYADRSHFTRAFTRQYRCTPKSVHQNARSTMFQ